MFAVWFSLEVPAFVDLYVAGCVHVMVYRPYSLQLCAPCMSRPLSLLSLQPVCMYMCISPTV